ncbi:gustatory receptor for sugar taste 64f-like isoform X8 [Frankliniella occidentalis]|uniref:Gustatory receptor for sugar taste 64f-like isoform X8 n=1 Tax=Frankliniella occidentalis TaxID=133901 RepID=A0A9C6XAU3_FRAOC|nr:gustatory receptor for sugar taste 64f-like isoform X8 [Frankliniella occidentalis]
MVPRERGHTVATPRRYLVWSAIRPALRTAQVWSLLFISLASPTTKLPSWHAAYALLVCAFILAMGGCFFAEFLRTPPERESQERFRFFVQQVIVLLRRLPPSGLYEWALLVCSLGFTGAFNFSALLLIVLSHALAECFRALTAALQKTARQGDGQIPTEAVEGFRVLYNEVCGLTMAVDHCVSPVILVAIFTDGLYICRFVLLSLAVSAQNWYSSAVVTVCFFRFVCTLLTASSVHSEWQTTKSCLHRMVPCRGAKEARRFFMQIGTERISLTALGMVPITKTLLPAVLGAILSYEIILVQFQLQKLKLVFSSH